MIDSTLLSTLGFMLILAGVIVVFIAVIFLLFSSTNGEKKVGGGGAIIIGPFPIVFGTDRRTVKALFVLSIILVVLFLVKIAFSYL
ncbi:MAG: DUF131 domain-containing protein [Candidatus Bathyarchaeota archaeon]|nr:DUF131 domain-containing protein [Candidatus Bathyarchaeota archaeon]